MKPEKEKLIMAQKLFSYRYDDNVIAARVGLPEETIKKLREELGYLPRQ